MSAQGDHAGEAAERRRCAAQAPPHAAASAQDPRLLPACLARAGVHRKSGAWSSDPTSSFGTRGFNPPVGNWAAVTEESRGEAAEPGKGLRGRTRCWLRRCVASVEGRSSAIDKRHRVSSMRHNAEMLDTAS